MSIHYEDSVAQYLYTTHHLDNPYKDVTQNVCALGYSTRDSTSVRK